MKTNAITDRNVNRTLKEVFLRLIMRITNSEFSKTLKLNYLKITYPVFKGSLSDGFPKSIFPYGGLTDVESYGY